MASLPLLLLAALNLWQGAHEAQVRVTTERIALARAAALTAGRAIEADIRGLRLTGRTLSLQRAEPGPALDQALSEATDRDSNLGTLVLFDADGWNLAISDTSIPPGSLNVADRQYFVDALERGTGVSRGAVQGRISLAPSVVLAARVDVPDGRPAVLAGMVVVSRLGEDLQAHLAERGVFISIVDAEGQVILHPDSAVSGQLPSLQGRPYVEHALQGGTGSVVARGLDDQELLTAYAPVVGAPWALLVQQPAALAFEAFRRDLAIGAALLGLAALLAIAIGAYLGTRLSSAYELERRARSASEKYAEELRAVTAENEQRRRFLERLIVSAPIPIAITQGPAHRFLTVNPRYQILKPGVPMVGRTMAEVFPEVTQLGVIDRLDRVYATGREFTAVDQTRSFVTSEGVGEEQYFTIVYAPYDDAEGRTDGVFIIALETSDAVRLRLRAEREKDEFLSTASHELKTPLTAIALAAQMIERVLQRPDTALDDARLKRSVRGMMRQIHRAGDLINDLLEVSRIQRAGSTLRRERVDLRSLVAAAVERTIDSLSEDNQSVHLEMDDGPLRLTGDETRLDQVLTNLLSNAIKYSPEHGEIWVTLRRDGTDLELRVVDHGMGIPEDERSLLFLPFSRTTPARESSIEGTGLGLYIARQIVEAHHGTIQYEPTPGGGATFLVRLPMMPEES